jgi:AraC family transcriptional regulator
VRLFQWANARQELARQLRAGETRLIGISFDDPEITPLHKCRYFACMTVPPELTDDATAGFFDFPEHLCAVARVECESVQEIQQAYRSFYRSWLPDSGFLMADLPPYDIIYDAPDVTPGGKYVFDLCVPVTVF